jgi:NAD(P)-dependent dehydrogenase (short-subunit alcohol dehydrogenase family)
MPALAVVTGANQGLGLETARQLAKRGFAVVLTSRDAARGERAARELGGQVENRELDVTRMDSITALASSLEGKRIDALVNNAGASFDGFDEKVARRTIDTNVYGALDVTDALRPLLADTARIVMVSSGMGDLSCLGPKLRRRLSDPNLGREELRELTDAFVQAVQHGDLRRQGWPANAYRVSKAALNALTQILARELATTRIRVNAVCPGWVRTRMGGASATRSVEEGAKGIVWAATLPPDGPNGGFFRDGKPIPW